MGMEDRPEENIELSMERWRKVEYTEENEEIYETWKKN